MNQWINCSCQTWMINTSNLLQVKMNYFKKHVWGSMNGSCITDCLKYTYLEDRSILLCTKLIPDLKENIHMAMQSLQTSLVLFHGWAVRYHKGHISVLWIINRCYHLVDFLTIWPSSIEHLLILLDFMLNNLYWRVTEYATLKFATLTYWLCWVLNPYIEVSAGRSFLWTSLISLKTDSQKDLSFLIDQGRVSLITGEETRNFVINCHPSHLFF